MRGRMSAIARGDVSSGTAQISGLLVRRAALAHRANKASEIVTHPRGRPREPDGLLVVCLERDDGVSAHGRHDVGLALPACVVPAAPGRLPAGPSV